jgi:hypothetical protein
VTFRRCAAGCGCLIYVKGKQKTCLTCTRRKRAKPEIQVIIRKGWQVKVTER